MFQIETNIAAVCEIRLTATTRFAEYEVSREIKALLDSAMPHAEWIAAMLDNAAFQMP